MQHMLSRSWQTSADTPDVFEGSGKGQGHRLIRQGAYSAGCAEVGSRQDVGVVWSAVLGARVMPVAWLCRGGSSLLVC